MLNAILSSHDTRAVRGQKEIVQLFEDVLQRRGKWIEKLALERNGRNGYSTEQWRSWLSQNSLSRDDMDNAVQAWKKEFETTEMKSIDTVEKCRAENTRESKAQARKRVNGAFKVHLKSLYCRPKLAFAFLQHPVAMVDTLLVDWARYMKSDEYLSERERSCRDRTEEDKETEVVAKMKVYRLRHQLRDAKALNRRLRTGEIELSDMLPDLRLFYNQFASGELQKDLDEATRAHGYGTLSTGERIGAFGPSYTTHTAGT